MTILKIIAICLLLQGCTIRELWNGLLDFNLIYILYFIIAIFLFNGLSKYGDWVGKFTRKEVYDSGNDEFFGKVKSTRSFMSLLMRWLLVISLSGIMLFGFLFLLDEVARLHQIFA